MRRNAAKVGVDQMLGHNSGRVRRHAQRQKNLADGGDQHLRLDCGHEIVFNAAGNLTGKSISFSPPSLRATSGPVDSSLDAAQDPDAGGTTQRDGSHFREQAKGTQEQAKGTQLFPASQSCVPCSFSRS